MYKTIVNNACLWGWQFASALAFFVVVAFVGKRSRTIAEQNSRNSTFHCFRSGPTVIPKVPTCTRQHEFRAPTFPDLPLCRSLVTKKEFRGRGTRACCASNVVGTSSIVGMMRVLDRYVRGRSHVGDLGLHDIRDNDTVGHTLELGRASSFIVSRSFILYWHLWFNYYSRNAVRVSMSIEVLLNAVNLNLLGFSNYLDPRDVNVE